MLPCISDPAGNEYDLSGLSKARKPWTAVDTFDEGKKRTFYLSVCTPLPYIPGCHGACRALDSSSPGLPPLPPPSTLSPGPCRHRCGVLPGDGRQQVEPRRRADQSSGGRQRVPEPRLRQRGQVQEPAFLHQDKPRVCPHNGACPCNLLSASPRLQALHLMLNLPECWGVLGC